MSRRPRKSTVALLIALGCALAAATGGATAGTASGSPNGHQSFVERHGSELTLDGKEFRFAGSSNYYLMYKSRLMVDDVLQDADDAGFRVLRMWGSLDIGDPAVPSTSIRGPSDGVYFQYWNPVTRAPAYNDGPNGLERLDYVIAQAARHGLKLVIPFVNNWNDFGGMDQYVRWRDISTPGLTLFHDSFYTDPVIKQWYKNWIAHVLNRTNTITGVKYKDDPTIMTWELGNEPRCLSAGAYGRSPGCTTSTLIRWADEMSTYIKSVDRNHLTSVGDEGFYCLASPTHWTEACGEGVDTVAFTRLRNIDVMSFHMYPDYWGTDVAWGVEWIKSHFRAAKKVGKPAMLGEFGLQDKSLRNPNYKLWLDTVLKSHGTGALYWILSGIQDDGTLYPDYDGFTVYCGSPVCTTIGNFGRQIQTRHRLSFDPVADHDAAVTPFNKPATLNVTRNDIAYGHSIKTRTLDLDAVAPGEQKMVAVTGGSFAAASDGNVTFTPTPGFVGRATVNYIVKDAKRRKSNEATVTVTVLPDPTAAIQLFSFETGNQGWAPTGGTGTLSQAPAFSGNGGTSSLEITVTGEGTFGGSLPSTVDLTGKIAIKVDLQTLAAQTFRKIAIQVGDNFNWCEDSGANTPQNTIATVTLDLNNLTCFNGAPDLTKLHAVHIYLQGGTFRIDNIRAE